MTPRKLQEIQIPFAQFERGAMVCKWSLTSAGKVASTIVNRNIF
jgi:hypothetical protein